MPEYKKTSGKKSKKPSKAANVLRLFFFWLIIVALGGMLFLNFTGNGSATEEQKTLSEILAYANEEKLDTITVRGNELHVVPRAETDLPDMVSRKEGSSSLSEQGFAEAIEQGKVNVNVEENVDILGTILDVAMIVVPVILVIAFLSYMMRQAQSMNNQSMGFGKAKARLYGNEKKRVTFADVAGNENAKQDLSEIVDFLKAPKKYEKLGAKIPSGVLLAGDPGTGKTLMARAVAGEAGVPFFSISGSEFAEMFVGVGASRVRDLFAKAKKNAPSIIFIDEIDAVAHKRDARGGAGREDEQTLNQILVEMDGFDNDTGVIVIAATNRVDMLDKALLRPGRFDRHVNVTLPERKDRIEILKVHFKNKPVAKDVDINALAAKTAGSSGADLALSLIHI